jgi:hypothetical protein
MSFSDKGSLKILRAQLVIEDNGVHHIAFMDVIEHEAQFWLVPDWLENPALKERRPTRLVGLAKLRHSRTAGRPEFVVEDPIPKSVFYEKAIPPKLENRYEILKAPDIRFQIDVPH